MPKVSQLFISETREYSTDVSRTLVVVFPTKTPEPSGENNLEYFRSYDSAVENGRGVRFILPPTFADGIKRMNAV